MADGGMFFELDGRGEHEFTNGEKLGATVWERMGINVNEMSPDDRHAFLMGFAAGVTKDINRRLSTLHFEHRTASPSCVINLRDFPWVVPVIQ